MQWNIIYDFYTNFLTSIVFVSAAKVYSSDQKQHLYRNRLEVDVARKVDVVVDYSRSSLIEIIVPKERKV